MNSSSNDTGRMFIQGIIILLGLIGLYYLYQYLFAVAGVTESVLLSSKQDANISDTSPITISPEKMPSIYDGGEFSITGWIYVQNWSYHKGRPKHIFSIGGVGSESFDTIRIYLGGYQPKLHVRFHTKSGGDSTSEGEALPASNRSSFFTTLATGADLEGTSVCDLPEVDLQRWIQIAISVNGRTVDVYMDGKLARSCVLPNIYKVDAGGYVGTLLGYGGFGGYIESIKMFNAALPPDAIYKSYMAGPEVPTNFLDYLKTFFEPRPEDKKE